MQRTQKGGPRWHAGKPCSCLYANPWTHSAQDLQRLTCFRKFWNCGIRQLLFLGVHADQVFSCHLRLGMVLWGYWLLPCHPLSPLLWSWGRTCRPVHLRCNGHLLCFLRAHANNALVRSTLGWCFRQYLEFYCCSRKGAGGGGGTVPGRRRVLCPLNHGTSLAHTHGTAWQRRRSWHWKVLKARCWWGAEGRTLCAVPQGRPGEKWGRQEKCRCDAQAPQPVASMPCYPRG